MYALLALICLWQIPIALWNITFARRSEQWAQTRTIVFIGAMILGVVVFGMMAIK